MSFESIFEEMIPEMGAEAASIFSILFGVLMIVYLLILGFVIVQYVLQAVSLYRISKRRGIHHPWLAWIPIGMNWILGSISDHYQYVAKQCVKSRRKILLVLSVISLVLSVLLNVIVTVLVSTDSVASIIVLLLFALVAIALSITAMVFTYLCYYDLFRSCRPDYAVLFLVLGILFSVTMPFFMIACSGSDQGMPPRRMPQQPVQIPEPQPEPEPEEAPVVETEIVDDSE